jgi:hypothetical protein
MKITDKKVQKLRAQNNGIFEREYFLPSMNASTLTMPAEMRLHNIIFFAMWTGPALLIYGWTLQYHVHW